MINIIYGLKGSGKTQKIVDAANATADRSSGNVVYVTNEPNHSLYVAKNIRFIDVGKYAVTTEETLLAFIEGLLAGNYDITDIFIDGPAKFVKADIADMEDFYKAIEGISGAHNVDFTVTVSAEEAPDYMKKYL